MTSKERRNDVQLKRKEKEIKERIILSDRKKERKKERKNIVWMKEKERMISFG